ncbi:hypothetical protein C6P64_12385 [Malikia granosa]|uniref:AAA domain-containing protein n=1 Tax=Malikia granosa TaxID=263067 RepID=A0A2S9K308_9BURK|nr:hypothetical protein C6P64_12385 [Malikia granosa]
MTAQIIAFSNHKGGAGKTLGSMSLAGFLAKQYSVLVVDADELQTATRWAPRPTMPSRSRRPWSVWLPRVGKFIASSSVCPSSMTSSSSTVRRR